MAGSRCPVMQRRWSLLRREASKNVVRAFLSSMETPCHYGDGLKQPIELSQQIAVSSF
uniref:Uncharacterized protein n=1 Tax=Arundo donax TaxID=35708 RepID=A0A0A8XTW3_ARUDO